MMSRLITKREPSGKIVRRQALRLGAIASLVSLIGRGKARAADALTIDPNGAKITNLDVAGSMKIDGSNTLEFGAGVTGKEVSAGKIGYQTWTTDALDIVGAATAVDPKRKIKFWAEGGATFAGDVVVAGAVKAQSIETNSGVSLAAVQSALNMLIPIGTIMAYGGNTRDANVVTALKSQGWLPCDGSVYSAQEYPELGKVIGNSFGTLRVPDLRGRFVRGSDQGTQRDPDAASRRPENGGNGGDNVGSVQDDEFKRHTHEYTKFPHHEGPSWASGSYWVPGQDQTGPAGGNETRPKTFTSTGSSRRSNYFHQCQYELRLWRYLTDSQQRGTGATKHQRVAEPIVNVSLRLGKEAHRGWRLSLRQFLRRR
jgi:hypothetical protein